MTFDLQKILESKEARRRYLASRPIAEKLRLLDAMRERELAIRGSSRSSEGTIVREEPEQRRPSSL
jgi:hypothetical protein